MGLWVDTVIKTVSFHLDRNEKCEAQESDLAPPILLRVSTGIRATNRAACRGEVNKRPYTSWI